MPIVHDYDTAAAFLHTRGKPVPRKKLANNTYLVRRDEDTIDVLLHKTWIVTYRPDTTEINTGGWLTVTTKERINRYIPFPYRVSSVKGTWWVERWLPEGREQWRYADGFTLVRTAKTYEQTWSYPGAEPSWWAPDPRTFTQPSQAEADDRHNAAMRKLIGRYVSSITADRLKESYAVTFQDCILCKSFETVPHHAGANARYRIVTMGDKMEDTQHLIDHMLDGEIVGSLVLAALSERGYLTHVNHGVDTVKRCLRAYLSQRLFVGATAPAHGKKPVLV